MHTPQSLFRHRFAVTVRRFQTAAVVALVACGGGGDTSGPPVVVNPPTVRGVAVTPSTATIRVGETQTLNATVDAVNGAGTGVTWSSESPSVASVSSGGVVTAIGVGTASIRATSTADTRMSATAGITVQAARGVTISPTTVSLGTGQTQALQAIVQIEAGLPATVTWRTSAAAIATVSAAGLVAGVAQGTATITAVAVGDTMLRATTTVNVVPVVRAVAVSPTTASLFIAATQQLTAIVTADAGVAQTVTWRSSNPAAATVSATGLVSAVALGSTTITVLSTVDTTRRATSAITVAPRPVTVAITQRNVGINPGATSTLTAAVGADPGVATGVTWTSSANAIATVSAQGVVAGITTGSAVITATSIADVTKRDTVTVNIIPRLANSWTPTQLGGALRDDVNSIVAFDANTAFATDLLGDVYRWNGSAWSLSLSTSNDFRAVHGTTASNVIAVGTNGAISRWNGATWSAMASTTTRALNAVWVVNASVAWAAGENGTVVQLLNGAWTTETTGSSQSLNGIWAGDALVYAVGAGGEVRRRTVGGWSRVTVPTAEDLYGVHGNSSADIVIVGSQGTAIRFDGTVWTVLGVGGFSGNFYGISGSTANAGRRYLSGDGGVAQLDGSTIIPVATPYTPQLFGVTVEPSGAAWAAGERGAVLRSGTPWTTNNLAPDLLDVWATAPNNAFAVGEFGFVYRWNGTNWARQQTPTLEALVAVWAIGANDAFAGGENGVMLRWNGTAWTTLAFPSSSTVSALWGTAANNVYATTQAGEIFRFNGTTWTLSFTIAAPLWTIFGASANDVYAASENGSVLRQVGSGWSVLPAPLAGRLTGIWLTGPSSVYVAGLASAGTSGIAFRYNGTSWSSLQPGTTPSLTSIWGLTESELYATGDAGTLLRFNGNQWSTIATGTTDLLWAISGAPNATGGAFAVGLNSTIVVGSNTASLRTTGAFDGGRATGTLEPSAAVWGMRTRGPQPHGVSRVKRRR